MGAQTPMDFCHIFCECRFSGTVLACYHTSTKSTKVFSIIMPVVERQHPLNRKARAEHETGGRKKKEKNREQHRYRENSRNPLPLATL